MSKGLEALQHLYAKLSCKSNIEEITENLQEYDIIEKELKALEIIRNRLNERVANIGDVESQKCLIMLVMENEEEYDLLKEVLL